MSVQPQAEDVMTVKSRRLLALLDTLEASHNRDEYHEPSNNRRLATLSIRTFVEQDWPKTTAI